MKNFFSNLLLFIERLDAQLPADFGDCENVTYIEPFLGGGAMYGAYDRTRLYEQNGTPNIVCRNYKKN